MKRLLMLTLAGSTILRLRSSRPGPKAGPSPKAERGSTWDGCRASWDSPTTRWPNSRSCAATAGSQAIRQRADLRIARSELNDLLRAPAVDEKAVSAKLKQVTDLEAAAAGAGRAAPGLRRVLTPEQLAKLQTLMRRPRPGEGGPASTPRLPRTTAERRTGWRARWTGPPAPTSRVDTRATAVRQCLRP